MKAGTLMFRDEASHFFLLSLSCGSPRYEVRDAKYAKLTPTDKQLQQLPFLLQKKANVEFNDHEYLGVSY